MKCPDCKDEDMDIIHECHGDDCETVYQCPKCKIQITEEE
jgi:hypothetical protein